MLGNQQSSGMLGSWGTWLVCTVSQILKAAKQGGLAVTAKSLRWLSCSWQARGDLPLKVATTIINQYRPFTSHIHYRPLSTTLTCTTALKNHLCWDVRPPTVYIDPYWWCCATWKPGFSQTPWSNNSPSWLSFNPHQPLWSTTFILYRPPWTSINH